MTDFLRSILEFINTIVSNYGWSIIIFTALIRLVLMPLEIKSRKGMRKMQIMQPQINALSKKYANDKQKLQQKQAELFKKEKYNPLSGCLPMLIQLPVLFIMFAAMRAVANEQLVHQVFDYLSGQEPVYEGWFWVKNIWSADSIFAPVTPDINSVKFLSYDIWQKVYATLGDPEKAAILANLNLEALDFSSKEALAAVMDTMMTTMQSMPLYQAAAAPTNFSLNFLIFQATVYKNFNGLLILPILAGVSQVLMTKLNPTTAQPAADAGASSGQTPGMGNFMKYFFPVFSVYICLTSNAGFALYWVAANVIASIQSVAIARYLDNKDKEKSAMTAGEGTVK